MSFLIVLLFSWVCCTVHAQKESPQWNTVKQSVSDLSNQTQTPMTRLRRNSCPDKPDTVVVSQSSQSITGRIKKFLSSDSKHSVSPVVSPRSANAQICLAMTKQDQENFCALLKNPNVDVNHASSSFGYTLLHRAVMIDEAYFFKNLLKHPNLNVNLTDLNGNTPLHLAVKKVKISYVKLLLARNDTKILASNCEGQNLLHLAAATQSLDMVMIILNALEKLEAKAKEHGKRVGTPLYTRRIYSKGT